MTLARQNFGAVYLVGAGPGDPGLITVRGRDLLARTGAVIYDSLANEALLSLAPNAEHIFVGKRPAQHSLTQDDINRILIEQAARHDCVVRLKGGDPFVFGRGGEEALALAAAGIRFEIVPGVTAGVGATAYAGIPVTHRGIASSVSFITGHLDPGSGEVDYSKLHLQGTLVFYMTVANLESIASSLIGRGRTANTPACLIESATRPAQRVIESTLGDIARCSSAERIEGPALLVVGDVVTLREQIKWFEDRPLAGRRVAVTQSAKRAPELAARLRELGADVLEVPTVVIETGAPPIRDDPAAFDWIVFTSPNAVEAFFEALSATGRDARALHGLRLCAVGDKTTETLRAAALLPDVKPENYEPHSVVQAMQSVRALEGASVLVPRADIARSALRDALEAACACVTEWRTYAARPPQSGMDLASSLTAFAPHYVLFGSASAARNLRALLDETQLAILRNSATFAAIGPVAAAAAVESGMPAGIVPARHTVADLIDALVEFDRNRLR
ncbi:MAG: uroporphyrinogen-III C-methyltransferase [Candidatus Hydrogenedentota bacterium]